MNTLFEKLEQMGLRSGGDPNERLAVTREDIEGLEAFFGFPFPPLYAEFLERYGQCYFDSGYAFFEAPSNWQELTEGAPTDFLGFNGLILDFEHTYSGFRREITNARQSGVPAGFLPLGDTDGDEPVTVFLCCSERNYNHVYALTTPQRWALDNGDLKTEDASDIAVQLAHSFEQFLEGIKVVSPEAMAEAFDEPPKIDPLFTALHAGDLGYLQRIVDAGKIASYRHAYGLTLLECAVVSRLDWPVEFLLSRGAPTEGAMRSAMANNISGAVRLLVAHGVDTNQPYYTGRDFQGRWYESYWTPPLIAAVLSNDYDQKYDMARVLVAAGADATLPDSAGKTAWDYVHPRNRVMRDILKQSILMPSEQRARYRLGQSLKPSQDVAQSEQVSSDQLSLFEAPLEQRS